MMATRGIIKNIAINPAGDKSGDPLETLAPNHLGIRNGAISPNRNFTRRPGYEVAFELNEPSAVSLLIDYDVGYAVTENGKIFRLDTLDELTEKLQGKQEGQAYYPTFVVHAGVVLIFDGGVPIKIVDRDSSALADAPNGRFVARIGSYSVVAGYEDAEGEFSEFRWCAADSPTNWTTGDSGFASVRKDGSQILSLISDGQFLYFFKTLNSEVWALIGGTTIFSRHDAASFNAGILSPHSTVKSINSIVWLGHTGDIYEMVGNTPQIISVKYKQPIRDMFTYNDLVGFDFYHEYKIRWFSGRHGKCFVYDYLNKVWSEENGWKNTWERLPFNSQMYFNSKCYVGSFLPNGEIYEFSNETLTDNGEPVRVLRQFQLGPFAEISPAGFISKIRIRIKRGVANAAEANPLLTVRYRADKRPQWESYYANLGENYDKQPYIDIYPNLYGSEFEFQLIEMDAVEYLVTDMELTLKPLRAVQ
jgi:hypothetical protein